MVFCGQCGLQLPPGSTRCPRCGAQVEENEATRRDLHIDDQTVASPSYIGRNPSMPGQPPSMAGVPRMPGTPPQPLVIRPRTPDYNTQSANDATSMMEASNFNNRMSTPQNMGGSFVGGG